MSGTNLLAAQTGLMAINTTALASTTLTPLTLANASPETLNGSGPSSSRYVVVGTALTALGTVLAGCSEPRPAPIANETALPPNQSNCTPQSTSPYCTSQREVLNEMVRMREEGHHSDQSLFVILGAVALMGTVGAFFLGRRRGRKNAEKLAAQQQPQVPPAPKETPAVQAQETAKADNK